VISLGARRSASGKSAGPELGAEFRGSWHPTQLFWISAQSRPTLLPPDAAGAATSKRMQLSEVSRSDR
jgi:hypothetical protein